MHLLQGAPTTLAVLANLNVSAMEAGIDANDFCDQLLDGNMEDVWLDLLSDSDPMNMCLDVDVTSTIDEVSSQMCTPVASPRMSTISPFSHVNDARTMNLGISSQQAQRAQPAAAAATAAQSMFMSNMPTFQYPPAFQSKLEPVVTETKPMVLTVGTARPSTTSTMLSLQLSTQPPTAPPTTLPPPPPVRTSLPSIPTGLSRPVLAPTGPMVPTFMAAMPQGVLAPMDMYAAQRVGPSPFDLLQVTTAQFNPFMQPHGIPMHMGSLDFEGGEMFKERNKQVHNVLERKRRRDLNDTFDALNSAVHVSKERKVVSSKACKREVLTDAIERVQGLKARNNRLNAERGRLMDENQMLLNRLKEMQARAA